MKPSSTKKSYGLPIILLTVALGGVIALLWTVFQPSGRVPQPASKPTALLSGPKVGSGPSPGQSGPSTAPQEFTSSINEQALLQAVKSDPQNLMTHLQLANLYAVRGQLQEATQEFEAVLAINPALWETHYNLGIAYYDQGQIDQAVKHYEAALALRPTEADIHFNLGLAYARLDQSDEAVKAYQDSLRLNPQNVAARNNLGSVYRRQGKLELALKEYEQALALFPKDIIAIYNIATTQDVLGRKKEAIQNYETLLNLTSGNPEYLDHIKIAERRLAILKKS